MRGDPIAPFFLGWSCSRGVRSLPQSLAPVRLRSRSPASDCRAAHESTAQRCRRESGRDGSPDRHAPGRRHREGGSEKLPDRGAAGRCRSRLRRRPVSSAVNRRRAQRNGRSA
ncbi:hypothetical protein ebA6263 [Aromatoleum aromaticum EbN1]|uniref:Uncharacterized protein n=1 Tax=Aromatoleum aromaticum (strain DSM 19018 / LMG 30748 / EbN1) TaxID=76114 RepID=Q5NZ09_AROAE|nr:hypothetical protein ebA6263 [Aromatoleum aromaticum EbN1]